MTLKVLQIEQLRNFSRFSTSLHPHLNIITGVNGSGKTTFLEAIYLLSCGRSFRTRELAALISHGQTELTLFAKTADEQMVAIKKSLHAATLMRLNNAPCQSASELARCLPTQVCYQDIFQIIDAGPMVRRNLLDWGVFHVKHTYYCLWKDYRRAILQRNRLLRQNAQRNELAPWNEILSDLATQIDALRQDYLSELNYQFQQILASLTDIPCQLHYYKGWDRHNEQKSLHEVLRDSYAMESQLKYTRYGSHHAELLFKSGDHKLKHYFSRGQQKLILFALKVAQATLVNQRCLFLLDDLFAEFDLNHIQRLIHCITQHQGQFFLTCHEHKLINDYVENGAYQVISLS